MTGDARKPVAHANSVAGETRPVAACRSGANKDLYVPGPGAYQKLQDGPPFREAIRRRAAIRSGGYLPAGENRIPAITNLVRPPLHTWCGPPDKKNARSVSQTPLCQKNLVQYCTVLYITASVTHVFSTPTVRPARPLRNCHGEARFLARWFPSRAGWPSHGALAGRAEAGTRSSS